MMTEARYVVLVIVMIAGLYYIVRLTNASYDSATSVPHIKDSPSLSTTWKDIKNNGEWKPPVLKNLTWTPDTVVNGGVRKANATFVILARNSDLNGVVTSIKQMEDRFNKKYHYPYVLLNEEPFDQKFKDRVTELTDSLVEFGLIPKHEWTQPSFINETRATQSREKMVKDDIIYGGSVPYRNMCRFNSGFFYRQELVQKYQFYWRIEPDVKFFCDLDYDPFLLMKDQNKMYGFTLSLYEYEATIPTLWKTVKGAIDMSGLLAQQFIREHPQYVANDNAMAFLSDDGGETYNHCHFWSNFEIGNMDLWRGEAYTKFFEYLDKAGGFYYERWGDAPVHSIGAALFAKKEQIHFFEDIGYRHEPFQHCPQGSSHKKGKCWCDESQNFDYEGYSCTPRYEKLFQ